VTLKIGLKVREEIIETGTIRQTGYGFLLNYCKFPPRCTGFEVLDFKYAVTLKLRYGSVKIIESTELWRYINLSIVIIIIIIIENVIIRQSALRLRIDVK